MSDASPSNVVPFQSSNAITLGHQFCKLANFTIEHIALHKYLYLAHMALLGVRDKPMLIGENFVAWFDAPIIRSLFNHCKVKNNDIIKEDTFGTFDRSWAYKRPDEFSLLNAIYNKFGYQNPFVLDSLIHRVAKAWHKNYAEGTENMIPNREIFIDYQQRLK